MSNRPPASEQKPQREHEPEFEGPVWKHPYMIYIWLTAALFVFLLGAGWFAWTSGILPDRGISESGSSQ